MNFEQFKSKFAYKGKAVYASVFERHQEGIKTKKLKFAVNNLEKIFKATFKLSSKIGFHEMSLRDLCRETGLSMGGIYSCIDSKDAIAIFVKEQVRQVSFEIVEQALEQDEPKQALEDTIHHLIYAAEILHPWFYFLYFETRSLPKAHQQDSKNIEFHMVNSIETLLKQIYPNHNPGPYHFIANTAVAMIQERYLKHWKFKDNQDNIDDYADGIIKLLHSAFKQT